QIWDNSKVFEDFYFDGSIGYLLSLREGLALLNLTNLQQIEYIDKEFNAGYYRSLGFHNGYPILLDRYEGLEIYKVKEDYSVEFVARFWDGGYGLDVKVSGNHAFVANAHNGLEIYQIRNSRAPELKSRINLGFQCQEIFINKNLVYTISFDFNELYIIDISNKRKPKVLSVQNLLFELDNITYHPMYAAIFGDQAFVSYYSPIQGFLAFIDLTNTSAFQITSLLPLDSYISKISYASPYLYLMPNSRDCYIYYNNGTEWEVLTEFSIDDSVQDLFIYENFAYFATSYDLVIYNITNPLFPTETAIFHGSNYSYEGYDGVFVESDVAYLISEYEGDVHFVNILDKEYPYLEGIFKCNDSLTDLFVKDQVLYLTGAYVNLEIIQLDSLLNYIIYAPIAGIAVIIGIPILILVFARARRRRDTINNIPTTQMLPREEIQDPTQAPDNDSGIIVSPEDFDDSKLLVLAKKLVEAAEEDSK
ncbi:MAG: hypothetical protein GNW80_17425, partial [Asgard group archaeon]|nr:hypothetical protein [Asgard group archaeon]